MVKPRYKRPTPLWHKILVLLAAVIVLGLFTMLIAGFMDGDDSSLPPASPSAGPLPGGSGPAVGDEVDSLDGVAVYYNGKVANVSGRNTGPDGYNLGLKYQCVEFVKRYYHDALDHKMPDPWGHARDFFNPALADGALNGKRGLVQYKNGGKSKPQKGDLLVFGPTRFNSYGHVAIVSEVKDAKMEFIQQNPGPSAPSREKRALKYDGEAKTWRVDDGRLLGWLRKPS